MARGRHGRNGPVPHRPRRARMCYESRCVRTRRRTRHRRDVARAAAASPRAARSLGFTSAVGFLAESLAGVPALAPVVRRARASGADATERPHARGHRGPTRLRGVPDLQGPDRNRTVTPTKASLSTGRARTDFDISGRDVRRVCPHRTWFPTALLTGFLRVTDEEHAHVRDVPGRGARLAGGVSKDARLGEAGRFAGAGA